MSIFTLLSSRLTIGACLAIAALAAAHAGDAPPRGGDRFYAVKSLVSDSAVPTAFTDANLKKRLGRGVQSEWLRLGGQQQQRDLNAV